MHPARLTKHTIPVTASGLHPPPALIFGLPFNKAALKAGTASRPLTLRHIRSRSRPREQIMVWGLGHAAAATELLAPIRCASRLNVRSGPQGSLQMRSGYELDHEDRRHLQTLH